MNHKKNRWKSTNRGWNKGQWIVRKIEPVSWSAREEIREYKAYVKWQKEWQKEVEAMAKDMEDSIHMQSKAEPTIVEEMEHLIEEQRVEPIERTDAYQLGLVVEGGGMRGIYAAGVLDILMEGELFFDGIVGVSAGAIHGASYMSNQKGRSIRYYKKYANDPRFMSIRSLLKTGDIVGKVFCYDELPNKLDPMDYDTFNEAAQKTAYYACVSNVETGDPEYLRVTSLPEQMDAIRASASLPYVSHIVEYDGMKLLDGGISDSIPINGFRQLGYNRNIVVLTREDGYQKKPANVLPGKILYRKYPKFVEAMKRRHEVYNDTLADIKRYEKDGSVFVIQPSKKLTIGRMSHDTNEIEQVYQLGRKDALMKLNELREWLMRN